METVAIDLTMRLGEVEVRGGVSKYVTDESKTAVMDVIGFLYVSLGSSTAQLHGSLGSRRASACL
jgi:hypothetical protein